MLVIVPGVLAALALLALHTMNQMVTVRSQTLYLRILPSFPKGKRSRISHKERLELAERFGATVGRYLRGVFAREHTMLRVRANGRTIVCRAASPVGIIGVSIGDRVELRGRLPADGILRVFDLRNQSTGGIHRPSFIGPRVVMLGFVSAVLVAMLVGEIAGLSAH